MYVWPQGSYIESMKNKETFQVRIQDPSWKGGIYYFEAFDLDEALRLAQSFCPTGKILEAKTVKAVSLEDAFCTEEFPTEPQDFRPTLAPMAAYD